MNRFLLLDDARRQIDHWRADYNGRRPHSTRGNLAPNQFAL